jgi:Fibronectin type III domain
VSEQPTARATRPPAAPAKAPGKKYAGLTRNQWLITGGVFAAAVGYILWKRRKAAAAGSTAATNQGSDECTDSNGNPVDCGELEASELAGLQNGLDQLGAQSGGGGGGTTGTVGTVPVGTISTTTGTGATGTPQPSSTATTTTTPPAPGGPITAIPIGLHTTAVNTTSVQVAWTAPSIPAGQGPLTGYTAEVYTANGQSEGSSWTVPKTQLYANAGGLKSKTAYHLNVWCEPAKTGGPHASVSFTTK